MPSRFAGSGSNCLEGELEQGAGKGPLRCHGDDATPAGHVGRTQSRADGSVRAAKLRISFATRSGDGNKRLGSHSISPGHNPLLNS